MQIFFLFLLFISSVFSVDPSYLLALTESDPSAVVDGKFNVITGDLYLDYQNQNWPPYQNRFFDSATNWSRQSFPRDTTHSDYWKTRNAASQGNLAGGGYETDKGVIQGASLAINAYKR